MKRSFALAACALLMLGAVAWAQESDDGQEELDFSSGLGAKVRLMQLEAAVERNILWGGEIVSAVEDKGGDAGGLSAILAEMKALKDEVAAIQPGGGEEAAKEFVDIKASARELTREFKVMARSMLTKEDADALRKTLKGKDRGEWSNLGGGVDSFRREYNAERVSEALGILGVTNKELVDRIKSGEANKGAVMKYVNGVVKGMSSDEKKQVRTALKERDTKRAVFGRALAQNVRFRLLERLNQSVERRLERADEFNLTDEERVRLEERRENVSERLERIKGHMEVIIDKWAQKKTANIEGQLEKLENRTDKLTGSIEKKLLSENLTDKEKQILEDRLVKFSNRSDVMKGKLQDRLDGVQEKSNKMNGKSGVSGGVGGGDEQ